MKNIMEKYIDDISNNYNRTIGVWTEKIIKQECNPILYWLLVHTKNKYVVKLAGFEIQQDIPSLNNNFSKYTAIYRHNKFIAELDYKLNIKK